MTGAPASQTTTSLTGPLAGMDHLLPYGKGMTNDEALAILADHRTLPEIPREEREARSRLQRAAEKIRWTRMNGRVTR